MTSIRKLAYAAVLTAALTLAPGLATAQEECHGKFTLPHEVLWGRATVPAGEYEFSFDANSITHVLTLRRNSGTPAGFMVLVRATEEAKPAGVNRLVLEKTADGSYVSAMQLPEFGLTLDFGAPSHDLESQIAKSTTTAASSGQ